MMVTDICRDDIVYDEDEGWYQETPDYEKLLNKYNRSKNRFSSYLWGIYITSLNKAVVGDAILELKYDFLYSDTDSVKFLNYIIHKAYFDNYNANVRKKLLKMCDYYKINPELIEPTDIKGQKQLIGIWDYEGEVDSNGTLIPTYSRFKYLGAKRYMVEYPNGELSFTVSGCSKKLAVPYLKEMADLEGVDVFSKFDNNMYIPSDLTRKNTHTYIDTEVEGFATDYLGNKSYYKELSSIHLEETEFTLSLTSNWIDYIIGIRGVF